MVLLRPIHTIHTLPHKVLYFPTKIMAPKGSSSKAAAKGSGSSAAGGGGKAGSSKAGAAKSAGGGSSKDGKEVKAKAKAFRVHVHIVEVKDIKMQDGVMPDLVVTASVGAWGTSTRRSSAKRPPVNSMPSSSGSSWQRLSR